MRRRVYDLVGKVVGRLTVIGEAADCKTLYGRAVKQFGCRCACGLICIVRADYLACGHTKSCGCLARERRDQTKHGHAKRGDLSKEYQAWRNAMDRCTKPKNTQFADYGGRGIRFAAEWVGNFEKFLAHVGPAPNGTTLDRIDVNGNYEPGNVRWATPQQQSRNRRSNRLITARGETKTLVEWAEISGVGQSTIGQRLRYGFPPETAIFAPVFTLRSGKK